MPPLGASLRLQVPCQGGADDLPSSARGRSHEGLGRLTERAEFADCRRGVALDRPSLDSAPDDLAGLHNGIDRDAFGQGSGVAPGLVGDGLATIPEGGGSADLEATIESFEGGRHGQDPEGVGVGVGVEPSGITTAANGNEAKSTVS